MIKHFKLHKKPNITFRVRGSGLSYLRWARDVFKSNSLSKIWGWGDGTDKCVQYSVGARGCDARTTCACFTRPARPTASPVGRATALGLPLIVRSGDIHRTALTGSLAFRAAGARSQNPTPCVCSVRNLSREFVHRPHGPRGGVPKQPNASFAASDRVGRAAQRRAEPRGPDRGT